MVYVYILELENNKYYVGKTTNPNIRINNHFNSHGSNWTKLYKPIKVLDLISNCDDFDEDKFTVKFMKEYGIENVRGGSFCEMILSSENITTLKKMINTSSNSCFYCGNKNHFSNNCMKKIMKGVNNIFESIKNKKRNRKRYVENENKENDEKINNYSKKRRNNCCHRCGNENHYQKFCYAKKDIYGNYL